MRAIWLHACRQLRAAGVDPKAKRDTERAAAKIVAAKAVTFDQCVAAFLKAHGPGWRNPKHRQQWQNTLASYASPIIGGLPIGAVDVGLFCGSSNRFGRPSLKPPAACAGASK